MTRLLPLSGDEAIAKFVRLGYVISRQKGSHIRLRCPDPHRKPITVPRHKTLKLGLLRRIVKDAGLTVEKFVDL